jgi:hypothetical protein
MSRPGIGATVVTMERFEDVLTRWVDAEARGDADALAALLDADFRGDGPGGEVLGKDAYLHLHRSGAVRRGAFAWQPTELRVDRQSAVATGVQSQIARHRGHDWSGTFACTLVAIRAGATWAVVNVQLSERIAKDRPVRAFENGQVADVLRTALYERGGHADHQ